MAGVNKVILVGNLGQDPEVKNFDGGGKLVKFSLATSSKFTGKDGQKQEKTEWHKVIAWGKLAEICEKYLSKGSQIYIEGRLETNKWQNREGKD
ncbi:single-stranded DNA-binding protein, partial [Candidatus Pacearchaeota archaeon]|nr:single-stranded DNA-binding protein [Candidatus Pacearchaeota archaeon]